MKSTKIYIFIGISIVLFFWAIKILPFSYKVIQYGNHIDYAKQKELESYLPSKGVVIDTATLSKTSFDEKHQTLTEYYTITLLYDTGNGNEMETQILDSTVKEIEGSNLTVNEHLLLMKSQFTLNDTVSFYYNPADQEQFYLENEYQQKVSKNAAILSQYLGYFLFGFAILLILISCVIIYFQVMKLIKT